MPNLEVKARENREGFVFFDLETTGLNFWEDEITEIGAVMNGDIQYNSLIHIKDKHKLTPFITRLTGITQHMLDSEGQTLQQVLRGFTQYLIDCSFYGYKTLYLVAHNCDGFDKFVLRNAYYQLDGQNNPLYKEELGDGAGTKLKFFDTIMLAKYVLPGRKSYSLKNLCEYLGVNNPNHHRAVNDAQVCGEVFWKLIELLHAEDKYPANMKELYERIYGTF